MRIEHPIEQPGYFWDPNRPEFRVAGTLRINESAQATLEVYGDPDHPFFAWPQTASATEHDPTEAPFQRIAGMVEPGGKVILDKCFRQRTRIVPSGGWCTSDFVAETAFVGSACQYDQPMNLAELSLAIDHLPVWLQQLPVQFSDDVDAYSGTIEYVVPDTISSEIGNGITVRIDSNLTLSPWTPYMTEASVSLTPRVSLVPPQPLPMADYRELASELSNYFSFALGHNIAVTDAIGFTELSDEGNPQYRKRVNVYDQLGNWSGPIANGSIYHSNLFTYPYISEELDVLLANWFGRYTEIKPAFNLYFAAIYNSNQFLDTQVLWLVQALEVLHRRSAQDSEMSPDEFSEVLEAVLAGCPENRRSWIAGKLQHANEPSLRSRLKGMLGKHERWFGNNAARSELAQKIVATRNYLTHYDGSSGGLDSPSNLFLLRDRLSALFQICLLEMIGFDESRISEIVERSAGLRNKLGIQTN